MKYIIGVLIPVLIQMLFTAVVILANTGNGSWLGLGAFLLALFAIPVTALINFLVVRNSEGQPALNTLVKCYASILLVPVLVLVLLFLG